MFAALKQRLTRWFSDAKPSEIGTKSPSTAEAAVERVPYDENLLERARTQWQFGDWSTSLAEP